MVKNTEDKPLAQNKKARHDYSIKETFETGVVLTGTEIKSVRQSKIQIADGFARVREGEVWLTNVHIAHFEQGNINNVEELRTRKLLMKKSEIAKVEKELKNPGATFIPLKVYLKNGFAKILMGIAVGKHDYDKRETIKRREQNKDIQRQLKAYNR